MTRRDAASSFAARPGAADAWVRAPEPRTSSKDAFTARLTIDVTPALRGRIKIIAFERGLTVTDMLRALLDREYGSRDGDAGGAP
ncbi:MAG: hypothetical protein JOY99_03675 [Sphingomonadaceae bacterium]|nr:hypothetical protein [Sphingomonadaceae bacterium]